MSGQKKEILLDSLKYNKAAEKLNVNIFTNA